MWECSKDNIKIWPQSKFLVTKAVYQFSNSQNLQIKRNMSLDTYLKDKVKIPYNTTCKISHHFRIYLKIQVFEDETLVNSITLNQDILHKCVFINVLQSSK